MRVRLRSEEEKEVISVIQRYDMMLAWRRMLFKIIRFAEAPRKFSFVSKCDSEKNRRNSTFRTVYSVRLQETAIDNIDGYSLAYFIHHPSSECQRTKLVLHSILFKSES